MRKLSTSLRELQTSDSISPELFNEVAQLGHFAGGLAVIWGSIVLFGSGSVWWAFGTLAVVAGVKEFWWDQHHESAVVRGSNFEDWSFYMLGATGAIVSTALEKFFFQSDSASRPLLGHLSSCVPSILRCFGPKYGPICKELSKHHKLLVRGALMICSGF